MPGDRASSIRVIAIGWSSRYGGLISVDTSIRLIFSSDQKCLLSEKDIWVIQYRIVHHGMAPPPGQTQKSHIRTNEESIRDEHSIINGEEWTLTTPRRDGDPELEF